MKIEKNKAAYIETYKHLIPQVAQSIGRTVAEFSVREELASRGMFGLVTTDFADSLAKYLKGKKVLEVMAGAGYLAHELHIRGIDIVATDDYSWGLSAYNNFPIEHLSVSEAIKKYSEVDYILVSWIPMGEAGTDLIRAMKKYCPDKMLLHIGEHEGGCTGNDFFFDKVEEVFDENLIEAQRSFENFFGIHDNLSLLKLK